MSPFVGRVPGKASACSSQMHLPGRGRSPSLPVPVHASLWRDRSGNAAAEFALILPAFVALTMAVIQYGSMYVTYNTMLVSARDASREVAVGRQTHGNAANRAKGKRPSWVSNGSYSVSTQDSGTTDVQTTVTVPGDEAALLDLLPTPDNLTVTVTMAKES